jgi:stage II sporulation protein D
MNKLLLALVGLVATAHPAYPASPEFKVELFSGNAVETLAIESGQEPVSLCGLKSDGPCLVVDPNQKAVCYADLLVRCHADRADRNFTFLTVASPAPFHLMPSFAGAKESVFLARNASVSVERASLRIVTTVDLESYVQGVLLGEAAILKAPAARQAMAILARTWALQWQGRHRAQGFDFCSLTHCQVFRLFEAGRTNAARELGEATLQTRGQVLKYHGALADPYFTACCGGMTEAAGNVWPDCAQPYLIAVRDPYCGASEHASWQRELSIESVQQVLREVLHLPLTTPLTDLSVEECDSSGRAHTLRLVAESTRRVDANEFRYAIDRRLGWGQIKSNLYTIERRGDSWVFSGHGLGHGVGLCQAGAEQMGRMGFSAGRILSTYFPGTEISSESSDDPDPIASSEHFELFYPASQEPWVEQALETLEQCYKEIGAPAEALPPRLRVQTWAATEEFIRATGQAGWMAAASDSESIALQPLELLARKRILRQTLRHELTHLTVHRLRGPGVPRWFEEGLVLYLTGERIEPPAMTRARYRGLEIAISQPRSEAEMKAAYALALAKVRRFARQQGSASLWRVLEHPTEKDLRWLGKD